MRTVQFLVLSVAFLFSFSCQKEENELFQETNDTIATGTPLLSLLTRVVQNPTSHDNVMDNSNFFRVQLPATVIVNRQQITVNNEGDYQLIQEAIDAFSTDDDIVTFIFPITIVFQDYRSQIITSQDELDDIIDTFDDEDNFHEIDCLTINYPIVINTFDSTNQVANAITFSNNNDLYTFLQNLNVAIIVSINYPFSIQNSRGQTVLITSNNELEIAIEDAIGECNANSGVGTGGPNDLATVIVHGTWYVSYYFRNNIVQTSDFNGYNFNFSTTNTINVLGNGNAINGTWIINSNGNEKRIEFEFEGNTLDRLSERWKVVDYTTTIIKLRLVGDGNGGNNYAYFAKN